MDRGTVEQIEAWDAHSLTGGYAGLHDLAHADFTGAITNGSGWLLMLNGKIIGEFHTTLSEFESGNFTAHEAPHPALVLLFALQGHDSETQAKYYTDDTPIAEVDQTLKDGNFTGYIELSENVLSGDYYNVYYGGRSMSVAFIGNTNRILTGNEAFDRANNEVGIYEVKSVDLEVQEIPAAPASNEPAPAAPQEDTADQRPAEAESSPTPEEAPATEASTSVEPADEAESEPEPDEPPAPPTDAVVDAESPAPHPPRSEGTESNRDPFSEEEEWRQARTVPALDPDETDIDDTADSPTESRSQPTQQNHQVPSAQETAASSSKQASRSRIAELETALESRTEQLAELREQVESITVQRDRLEEERDTLRQQVERLKSATSSSETPPGKQLDRADALSQTDVFIRYGSKGKATLENAHRGEASPDTVNSNLQLETHTRFDAADAHVGNTAFDEFLPRTIEYRFVEWIVRSLLYEIQGTDNQRALRDLYDVLPRIDRAGFQGSVSFEREDGAEDQRTFDIVIRDRMGQVLLVADLNDARDPASGDMMAELIESATIVAESHDTLGAAFLVTSSFFEPAALETANEASGGGFLQRDSRKSYVKLARKKGFHLCLIEARGDAFHVAVPEL